MPIDLLLPRSWGGYSAKRVFRGRQFTIVVDDVEQVVGELRRDALAGSLSPRI
ncbi:MAG TPA: hypothetical protein VJK02_08845 [Anaerolineales bacterium]|nr:hypothetical protein [Anaerolineales bacterium]